MEAAFSAAAESSLSACLLKNLDEKVTRQADKITRLDIIITKQTDIRLEMPLRMFFLGFKLIAYAPDCLERPLVGNALQLFAQSLDMDIYRS